MVPDFRSIHIPTAHHCQREGRAPRRPFNHTEALGPCRSLFLCRAPPGPECVATCSLSLLGPGPGPGQLCTCGASLALLPRGEPKLPGSSEMLSDDTENRVPCHAAPVQQLGCSYGHLHRPGARAHCPCMSVSIALVHGRLGLHCARAMSMPYPPNLI